MPLFYFIFAIPQAVLSFALCSICNGKSNGSVEECEAYVSGKKKKNPLLRGFSSVLWQAVAF